MDNEYTVNDLVSLAYDQKPVDFQQAFDTLVKDRLADAIADKKTEISQSVFSAPNDFNDDDDDSAEVEDEFEFDDEDQDLDQEDEEDGETA